MRISDWSSDVCSSDLTFNRSIGFSVAGVSNFIGSAFRLHQHPGERSLDQRQLVGILMARPGAREKGGRCRLRAARPLGVGLFASPPLVAAAAGSDAAAAGRLGVTANSNTGQGKERKARGEGQEGAET